MATLEARTPLRKKQSLLWRIWHARTGYLFILPLMLGLAMFSYYPAFSGIYHSFFDWDSVGRAEFIGLQNYKELWQDPVFLQGFATMAKIQLPKLVIGIVVPLVMAELIFNLSSRRAQYWYRILILFPIVTPGVVSTLIWKYMYDPNNGLLTALLRAFGVLDGGAVIDWLGDPQWVIFSVIFMGFPWIGGTAVLIYMSGLMNIPTEVVESSLLGRLQHPAPRVCHRPADHHRPGALFSHHGHHRRAAGLFPPADADRRRAGLQHHGAGLLHVSGGLHGQPHGYACAIGTSLFLMIFIITGFTYKYVKNDA